MKEILFYTLNYSPRVGGVAIFLSEIAKFLSQNFAIKVIAPFEEGAPDLDARQLYETQRFRSGKRFSSIGPIFSLFSALLRKKPDLIFVGHSMSTAGIGVVAAKKIFGIPYIVYVHGNDLSYNISNRYFYSHIDQICRDGLLSNSSLIIANSSFTQKKIMDLGFRHKKIAVLNPGTDVHLFNPEADADMVRRKYGLTEKKVCLSVARLCEGKNLEAVIKALPLVIKKIPNTVYMIIGSGPEERFLKKVVCDLGMEKYVKFLGTVAWQELPKYYCACDVFVMPTCHINDRDETFGMVFCEANACGKPVIGGHGGGVVDAVIHGETGLLLDGNDHEALAGAITALLTNDDYARRLGQNGRKNVVERLSFEKIVEKLSVFLGTVSA